MGKLENSKMRLNVCLMTRERSEIGNMKVGSTGVRRITHWRNQELGQRQDKEERRGSVVAMGRGCLQAVHGLA